MRPLYRWIIAIVLAAGLIAIFIPVYQVGFGVGGMATGSCSDLPPLGLAYLQFLWPVVMLIAALAAPVLIVRQARWRWVWLSLGLGLLTTICCYALWFPLLMATC